MAKAKRKIKREQHQHRGPTLRNKKDFDDIAKGYLSSQCKAGGVRVELPTKKDKDCNCNCLPALSDLLKVVYKIGRWDAGDARNELRKDILGKYFFTKELEYEKNRL